MARTQPATSDAVLDTVTRAADAIRAQAETLDTEDDRLRQEAERLDAAAQDAELVRRYVDAKLDDTVSRRAELAKQRQVFGHARTSERSAMSEQSPQSEHISHEAQEALQDIKEHDVPEEYWEELTGLPTSKVRELLKLPAGANLNDQPTLNAGFVKTLHRHEERLNMLDGGNDGSGNLEKKIFEPGTDHSEESEKTTNPFVDKTKRAIKWVWDHRDGGPNSPQRKNQSEH